MHQRLAYAYKLIKIIRNYSGGLCIQRINFRHDKFLFEYHILVKIENVHFKVLTHFQWNQKQVRPMGKRSPKRAYWGSFPF